MANKRFIFTLFGLFIGLLMTQILVSAQDIGTATASPNAPPSPNADVPVATITTTAIPTILQIVHIGDRLNIYFDLTQFEQRVFTFTGQANDVISITLKIVDGGVPFVDLVQPDQREIRLKGEDDETGRTIGFALRYYVLPESGVYSLKVNPFGAGGNSILQIDSVTPTAVEYDALVQGSLSEAKDAIYYEFRGAGDEQVIVDVEAEGFEIVTELYCGKPDECGQRQMLSYDTYQEAKIFRLPEDGAYVLVIRRQHFGGGAFKLSISPLRPMALGYGDTVEESISDAKVMQQFSFEGAFGDVVQIRVTGDGQIDTQLQLWQGTQLIASDDDGSNGLDPEIINTLLLNNGLYTIIVQPYSAGDEGTFTLSLERNPPLSLDNEAQILNFTPKFRAMVVIFSGVVDERARLTIRSIGRGQRTHIEVLQGGNEIVNASATGNENSSLEFIVPQDGTVEIFITGDTPIELSLERLD